jgi:type VI protein secretion system component Hcp
MPNAYYLRLGSGKSQILGTSRDRYHMGWIKLESFSQQSERPPSGSGIGPGRGTISQFNLMKLEDRTSPEIFRAVHEGRSFKSADVEVAQARTGIPKVRMSLTDVLLGTYSLNAGFLSERVESFSLNFAKVEWNYNPIPDETAGDMLQLAFKSLGLAPVP